MVTSADRGPLDELFPVDPIRRKLIKHEFTFSHSGNLQQPSAGGIRGERRKGLLVAHMEIRVADAGKFRYLVQFRS